MTVKRVLTATVFCLGQATVPVLAGVDLTAAETCMAQQIASGQNPALCLDTAHADCLLSPADAPAVATLCFTEARKAWDAGIAAEMARIRDNAPEKIAAIAAIEVKYDLLTGLTQCDRMEELAKVASEEPADSIQRQKARCTASSAGLAYLRLRYRGSDIE
ncbi:hypothetical protein [Marimonas arenosa]|uniref:DUF1311 domain-containing protein n=1 Tax=Marimonas arenosa TaxID=1795305 RepID=A0AAE3W937_9RHOB|nr:hypothetical protein [Marimonas arenosa]MDQ2088891.1 hypothetical protein [Marimonas arenosa]